MVLPWHGALDDGGKRCWHDNRRDIWRDLVLDMISLLSDEEGDSKARAEGGGARGNLRVGSGQRSE